MKQKVAVTWEMCGYIDVEADSMAEAMKKVKDDPDDYDIPASGEYVDGSFSLSSDDVEDMELMGEWEKRRCTKTEPKKKIISNEEAYNALTNMLRRNDIPDEDREVLSYAKMIVGTYPQIKWERDISIEQLHELGYEFGEKAHES